VKEKMKITTTHLLEGASMQGAAATTKWTDFDKAMSHCHDSLRMIEQMLKSQIVTVCDIKEIEDTVNKQQV
jgi:dystrophin